MTETWLDSWLGCYQVLILGWMTLCGQVNYLGGTYHHRGYLSLSSLRSLVNHVPACLAGIKADQMAGDTL